MASRFITPTGAKIFDANSLILKNDVTANSKQAIFTSTITGNNWVIDRPYSFFVTLNITTPSLTAPTLTFDITLGSMAPLQFVSNVGLIAGTSMAGIDINGFIVLRTGGAIFVKFNVIQPGSPLAALSLSSTNINQNTTWNGVDITVDQQASLNVSFSNNAGDTTLVRQFLARSEY